MAYGSVLTDVVQSSVTGSPAVFKDGAGTETGTLCRAWGNFYYTGSVMSIRASFNVSSITRNGTGDYTINYTNAFSDANYSWVGSTNQNAAGNNAGISVGYQDNSSNVLYSTTQTRILVKFGTGATVYDPPSVTFAVFR